MLFNFQEDYKFLDRLQGKSKTLVKSTSSPQNRGDFKIFYLQGKLKTTWLVLRMKLLLIFIVILLYLLLYIHNLENKIYCLRIAEA